ncbi:MAG: DNRLRE domain-containing protein [Myxococcota bacterium]
MFMIKHPATLGLCALALSTFSGCIVEDELIDDLDVAEGEVDFRSSSATVDASADTFIRFGRPYQSDSDQTFLSIKQSGKHRSLIQFDPADIDAVVGTDSIISATLQLSVAVPAANWPAAGGTLDVHAMTQAWTNNATWTCPDDTDTSNTSIDCDPRWQHGQQGTPPYDTTATASHDIANGDDGIIEFDVTADVVNGMPIGGWIVRKRDDSSPGRVRFDSIESGNAPVLVLETEADECPDDPDKTEAGICGCGVPDDTTGCMTECPVYTDPLETMMAHANANMDASCMQEAEFSCDGTTLTLASVGSGPGSFEVTLNRSSLDGWSTEQGTFSHCDGLFSASLGHAAVSPGAFFTCQPLFDAACEAVNAD